MQETQNNKGAPLQKVHKKDVKQKEMRIPKPQGRLKRTKKNIISECTKSSVNNT